MQGLAGLPGYERLDGGIPVVHPTGMEGRATELRRLLEKGTCSLSEILGVEPPELEALLVADGDWEEAPRDNARPYPLGLPYFTRAVRPPALVLPETLSPAFQRSEEHTSELQSRQYLVCRLLLEKKNKTQYTSNRRHTL